jgi:acetyl esterase/lipase
MEARLGLCQTFPSCRTTGMRGRRFRPTASGSRSSSVRKDDSGITGSFLQKVATRVGSRTTSGKAAHRPGPQTGSSLSFMILHGTADGSVDFSQGLEFYAAARRLGKPVILLAYPDEAHHLGRRENQKDFQIRMRQFLRPLPQRRARTLVDGRGGAAVAEGTRPDDHRAAEDHACSSEVSGR